MRSGARVAIGAVVTAGVLAGGTLAVLLPSYAHTTAPVVVRAAPAADQTLLACTGPLLAAGRDPADAAALAVAAPQQVALGADDPSAALRQEVVAAPEVPGAEPLVLIADPRGETRTEVAAAGSSEVVADDLRGFAAAACARPSMQSWLVGGTTEVGAADLVLLSNPGAVAARADISVFGAEGETQPAAGAGIVVPPRTQRVVSLASLALGQSQPVLRVTATAAPLRVALQTSLTRTLVPGGVDVVGAAAAPAPIQIIPAVTVTEASGDAEPTTVRLLAPSDDTAATVSVSRVDAPGAPPVDTTQLDLVAGVPSVVALPDLAPGAYTVRVEAGAPVLAAVWRSTGTAPGGDIAWYSAAEPLSGVTFVAVADGPSPVLTLVGDDASDRSVVLTGTNGEQVVAVPAGTAVPVAVSPGEIVRLEADGLGIRASITYSAPGGLAGYPVAPSEQAAAEIAVTVR
ncbi:hypothetical protein AOA12_05600 [Microbacterium sp. No. 7]|nr:hypothetical protein AOA12_05600 [Microbacterium sp. No. 7]